MSTTPRTPVSDIHAEMTAWSAEQFESWLIRAARRTPYAMEGAHLLRFATHNGDRTDTPTDTLEHAA